MLSELHGHITRAVAPRSRRRRTRAYRIWLLLIAVGGLAITACGSGAGANGGSSTSNVSAATSSNWSTVVAAAKKEGTVTFYAGISPIGLERIDNAFTKQYGIKVNLVQLSSIPLIQRLEDNLKAHKQDADVVNFGDPPTLADFIEQGGIINENPDIPAASYWPAKYYSHGVGVIDVAVTTIAYNTKLVPASEAPKSWQDLLNPRWKGQIGIFDPSSINAAEPYQYLYDAYGASYLKGLAAQDPKDYSSGADQAQALASGEIKIAAVTQFTTDQPLISQGAPIKLVPNLDTSGWEGSVFAMASAPHPAAARLLLNFILSKAGQSAQLGGETGVSAINAPGTISVPAKFTVPDWLAVQNNLADIRSLLGLPPLASS